MPRKAGDTDARKQVGIWIRVSTEEQAQGDSPEHHEKRARGYADAKDWDVVSIYHLEGVSGKAVMDHPETKRMLADVQAGAIQGLIFSKLARLARNTRELLDFADIFKEHGAGLISLQEAIDTTSPAGRLFYTMIAAMAQWEREEIADRVAASIPIRAKLGKNIGGQASFGYRWNDGKLEPDPEEAPVRVLIYELFKEHKRKKTVARILNERGYRTRKGRKFTDTTVDRLLRDPTAKGLRRANYTRTPGANKQWSIKPEEEWIWLPVEPIVSEELWNECVGFLDQQRTSRQKKMSRKVTHLFTGIAYCSCGHKMYVPSNTPKYVCYLCRNKIPIEDLDAVFHEQLKELSLHPQELDDYLLQVDENLKAHEERVHVLEAKQRDIQKKIDQVYDLYLDGQIPKDGFGKRIAPYEEQLRQIEDELPRAQAECDVLKINHLSKDHILAEAADLYKQWTLLSYEEKRSIVEAVCSRITIGKDEIDIDLIFSSENDGNRATNQQGFMAATIWNRAG
ncbi:recombinase family protein [Kordiimonas aestuarii]|uniref:recombinase family protein n=1 Tax=Kordiimonas aestuarii TaxID=1005925 RepID=UPI0021CF1A2E|nr:recombinase family protein [Kordiimonas aestuarii]